jgi:hypothetical protein
MFCAKLLKIDALITKALTASSKFKKRPWRHCSKRVTCSLVLRTQNEIIYLQESSKDGGTVRISYFSPLQMLETLLLKLVAGCGCGCGCGLLLVTACGWLVDAYFLELHNAPRPRITKPWTSLPSSLVHRVRPIPFSSFNCSLGDSSEGSKRQVSRFLHPTHTLPGVHISAPHS